MKIDTPSYCYASTKTSRRRRWTYSEISWREHSKMNQMLVLVWLSTAIHFRRILKVWWASAKGRRNRKAATKCCCLSLKQPYWPLWATISMVSMTIWAFKTTPSQPLPSGSDSPFPITLWILRILMTWKSSWDRKEWPRSYFSIRTYWLLPIWSRRVPVLSREPMLLCATTNKLLSNTMQNSPV